MKNRYIPRKVVDASANHGSADRDTDTQCAASSQSQAGGGNFRPTCGGMFRKIKISVNISCFLKFNI